MSRSHWLSQLAVLLTAGIFAPAYATVIFYETNFDAPLYTTGSVVGQDGWSINGGSSTITNARAFSGTQSLLIDGTLGTSFDGAFRSVDIPPGDGFSINASRAWWVQAMIYLPANSVGAGFIFTNSLGGCPLFETSGSGVPHANTCLANSGSQPDLGDVTDKWLLFRMQHTVPPTGPMQDITFSILGDGIDYSITLSPYSGPGSGQPTRILLYGDAYVDDFALGYDAPPSAVSTPTPVPTPSAGWLLGTGVAILLAGRRRFVSGEHLSRSRLNALRDAARVARADAETGRLRHFGSSADLRRYLRTLTQRTVERARAR